LPSDYWRARPVGPAERLLNMIGQRRQCATVYAAAFAINLVLCIILIPRFGIEGAAIATSAALTVESLMFSWVAQKRLGFNIFVFGRVKA
jgi:O-antigen/teichoic acid export membrane protein